MNAEIVCVSEIVNEIGEGPLWSQRDNSLYWVDAGPKSKTIMRYTPGSGRSDIWKLPERAASLIQRQRGGLVVGFQKGLAVLDPVPGEPKYVSLDGVSFQQERFNDSAVDRAGRLWIGSFDRAMKEPLGNLYCIDSKLEVKKVAGDLMISNGIAWSPDNRTMYVNDSRPGKIFAFDFDLDDGSISNRRIFLDFAGRRGRPDGCAMDSEGFLWVAEIDAGQLTRIAPNGSVERSLSLPVSKPTSIAFGGAALDTIYVTSMTFGLNETELRVQPYAGRLLAVNAGIKGLAEPTFDLS